MPLFAIRGWTYTVQGLNSRKALTLMPLKKFCEVRYYEPPLPCPMGGAPSACRSVSQDGICRLRDWQTQARHESVSRQETSVSRYVVPQRRRGRTHWLSPPSAAFRRLAPLGVCRKSARGLAQSKTLARGRPTLEPAQEEGWCAAGYRLISLGTALYRLAAAGRREGSVGVSACRCVGEGRRVWRIAGCVRSRFALLRLLVGRDGRCKHRTFNIQRRTPKESKMTENSKIPLDNGAIAIYSARSFVIN